MDGEGARELVDWRVKERERGNRYVSAMTHRCRIFIASGWGGELRGDGGAGGREGKRLGRRPGRHHCAVDGGWWRGRDCGDKGSEERRGGGEGETRRVGREGPGREGGTVEESEEGRMNGTGQSGKDERMERMSGEDGNRAVS